MTANCGVCHAGSTLFQAAPGRILNADVDTVAELSTVFANVAAIPAHAGNANYPANEATVQVNIWQAAKNNQL